MRTHRRNFDTGTKAAIIQRATDASGQLRCEGCSRALKYSEGEFDHRIAEGLRPDEDKKRKLTPADGQFLGRDCCHRGEGSKTSDDQARIAKAKRGEKKRMGITKSRSSLPSRGLTTQKAEDRRAKRAEKPQETLPPRQLFRSIS